MPHQLIYASTATTPLEADALEALLAHARARNAAQGISGALVYFEGAFLQVLEGERAVLDALMAQIARDLRHAHVVVLQASEVPEPVFGDWTMAYVAATAAQVAEWAGLGPLHRAADVLPELHPDPARAAQLAQRILAQLQPVPPAPAGPF